VQQLRHHCECFSDDNYALVGDEEFLRLEHKLHHIPNEYANNPCLHNPLTHRALQGRNGRFPVMARRRCADYSVREVCAKILGRT
jgi:hypothetical protein